VVGAWGGGGGRASEEKGSSTLKQKPHLFFRPLSTLQSLAFRCNLTPKPNRSRHLKRAVVQAASGLSGSGGGGAGGGDAGSENKEGAAAAAVPPAALALLAEAYSHLALHDDHGERSRGEFFPSFDSWNFARGRKSRSGEKRAMGKQPPRNKTSKREKTQKLFTKPRNRNDPGVFEAIAARLAGENDAIVLTTVSEEEGEEEGKGEGKASHRASVIAVTAPHAFTADDVARIARAASRCAGGCSSSPALVDAVASAASRLAGAALQARDARSLAAAAAAAAAVGGASAHPACAQLLALASDFLEREAELFVAREDCVDALPTALGALVAGGLLEPKVFARAAEAACSVAAAGPAAAAGAAGASSGGSGASSSPALSRMSDAGVVELTRAFADARAHDARLFEEVEREVLRRAQARGFAPERVVEILSSFNRSGFVSAPLAGVADRAARALAEELEEQEKEWNAEEVVNRGRARHSPASADDMS